MSRRNCDGGQVREETGRGKPRTRKRGSGWLGGVVGRRGVNAEDKNKTKNEEAERVGGNVSSCGEMWMRKKAEERGKTVKTTNENGESEGG